jgi:4-hydroxy-tetrahydrodipicolinate synthase
MLTGSLVAIATPMSEDGALDLDAYKHLIDWHIEQGTQGIVAVGTTGESPTVNVDEHCLLVETAVTHAAGRVPIIAGTGGNSTAEAIELTRYAKRVGADACLSVVPYYNKPTQAGLYAHFRKIAEDVQLPVILYNVPGRTVADMSNDTVVALAQLPMIVGIKDATSDLVRHVDLLRRIPPTKKFTFLSGNDDTALAYMLLGGHGVISVTANVAPHDMAKLCDDALAGRLVSARAINARLMPLHTRLFLEPNPIPVKWALAEMGLIKSGIRLPLTPLSQNLHEPVRDALRQAGCLEAVV